MEGLQISHAYDEEALKTWIYPTNKPVRDYQYNIVQKALFTNTLVALPTGLGKTFIAAVVIYNYFRWFPESKIVFMAPTKPLVAQQIEACYQITGISLYQMEEMNGTINSTSRRSLWLTKRLFFLTPQIFANDLDSGLCPAKKISLIVFDEAHRATGNYSYTQVIHKLQQLGAIFRVLALSATPGSDIKTVQQVVSNLLINNIELRTEESMDISAFKHTKVIKTIVCSLSPEIIDIQKNFINVMSMFTNKLRQLNAINAQSDDAGMHPYMLIEARKRYRASNPNKKSPEVFLAEGCFAVATTIAQSLMHLYQHGILFFYSKINQYISERSGHTSKLKKDFMQHPATLQTMAKISGLIAQPSFSSHPKLERLLGYVLEHFTMLGQETRVMIFSQYRESVDEIYHLLKTHAPIVRPITFIGQTVSKNGKGYTQKEQLSVIKKFQSGEYNVIVATSIGEEGLDIGEVDLIICFDAQASPIRMLQRVGRTGRKRDGKIVILLTEGKEEESYKKSQSSYKSVQKSILDPKKLIMAPKICMIPPGIGKPVPLKFFIEVLPDEFQRHKFLKESKASKSKSLNSKKMEPAKKRKKTSIGVEDVAIEEDEHPMASKRTKNIMRELSSSDDDIEMNSDDLLSVNLFSKQSKGINDLSRSKLKATFSSRNSTFTPKKLSNPVNVPSISSDQDFDDFPIDDFLIGECDEQLPHLNTVSHIQNSLNLSMVCPGITIPISNTTCTDSDNLKGTAITTICQKPEAGEFNFDEMFGDLPDDFFDDSYSPIDIQDDVVVIKEPIKDVDISEVIPPSISDTIDIKINERTLILPGKIHWPEIDNIFIYKHFDPTHDLESFQKHWKHSTSSTIYDQVIKTDFESTANHHVTPKTPVMDSAFTKKIAHETDSNELLFTKAPEEHSPLKQSSIYAIDCANSGADTNATMIDFDMDDLLMNEEFLNDLAAIETQFHPNSAISMQSTQDSSLPKPSLHIKMTPQKDHEPSINASHFKIAAPHPRFQTPRQPVHMGRRIVDTPQSDQVFQSPLLPIARQKKRIHAETQEEVESSSGDDKASSLTSKQKSVFKCVPACVLTTRPTNPYLDIEAALTDRDTDSGDEDESELQRDLDGFIVGDATGSMASPDLLAFYRKGLTFRSEDEAFNVNELKNRMKKRYTTVCSSPFMKSDDVSELGSMADFVVNDSQVEGSHLPLSSDL